MGIFRHDISDGHPPPACLFNPIIDFPAGPIRPGSFHCSVLSLNLKSHVNAKVLSCLEWAYPPRLLHPLQVNFSD